MERDGFDAFVAMHSTGLVRTAYLLTHDRGLAEDLVQTSLAKAWFAWGRIEGHPLATETLPEAAGRRGPGTGAGTGTGQGQGTAEVEDRADLWTALARLPKRQRAVVVLRYYEDLSEVDTAEIMQCSVGTVKSQASKALAKLRLDTALQTSTDEKGLR